MYCLFFLFASFFVCQISAEAEPIARIIQDYFNSESVRRFRKEWENYRKPIEHAILTALKETVGLPGMNVFVKKESLKGKLPAGYIHNDNQVRLILTELDLGDTPRCVLPELQLSLASNVLKIETSLSKMTIHANYILVRNKTDIIYEPEDQDPFKSSPFLFEQVKDTGKVAITMESCTLAGFIMTMLNGESVSLGYDHFKFLNCLDTVEIYRPGEDSPPVIARYNLYGEGEHGLGLSHLLMKQLLAEELVPKLQAAMFSVVNTSALFGNALQEYRENQEIVFQATAQYFTQLIRKLNRITVGKNHGAIEMEDYVVHWDDGRIKPSDSAGESLKLKDMVLTGLDTMYSAHCGGPFKIESIMIADEIRFSSLQVRGKLGVKSTWSDTFAFAADISDVVVKLQMGQSQEDKGNSKESKKYPGFKWFEVTGLRRMITMIPTLKFGPAESVVAGYLMNEVPKLLRSHLLAIFPEAIQIINDPRSESIPLTDSEDQDYQELKGKRERDIIKKANKKHFKSVNRARRLRRYRSRKRIADNQIRKK